MKFCRSSVYISMTATCAVAVLMLLLLFLFPAIIERYHVQFRPLEAAERTAILLAFYCCALPVLLALGSMYRLLRNILKHLIFHRNNLLCIRIIQWCCLAVSLICLIAAFGFPSMVFLSVIMAFLCLTINVVGQVMAAAIRIREENDLTV